MRKRREMVDENASPCFLLASYDSYNRYESHARLGDSLVAGDDR